MGQNLDHVMLPLSDYVMAPLVLAGGDAEPTKRPHHDYHEEGMTQARIEIGELVMILSRRSKLPPYVAKQECSAV